jgi:hypothetical protein
MRVYVPIRNLLKTSRVGPVRMPPLRELRPPGRLGSGNQHVGFDVVWAGNVFDQRDQGVRI